ncbi:hypothetical protein GEMRC1_009836 [Eukaryota sp. GEM-RC1]
MIYEDGPSQTCLNFKNNADDFLKKYLEHKKSTLLSNAIVWYEKALNVDGLTDEDNDTRVAILANRSQAHLYANNYRSAYTDATRVLSFNPSHVKAAFRGMTAALALQKPQEVLNIYDTFSKIVSKVPATIEDLVQKARTLQEELRRKQLHTEKLQAEKDAKKAAFSQLLTAFNLCMGPSLVGIADDCTEGPPLWIDSDSGNDLLFAKVLLLYPEFNTTDFLQEVSLSACGEDILAHILEKPLPQDSQNVYTVKDCELYYRMSDQGHWDGEWKEVPRKRPLITVMSKKKNSYIIPKVVTFFVMVRSSEFRRRFASNEA